MKLTLLLPNLLSNRLNTSNPTLEVMKECDLTGFICLLSKSNKVENLPNNFEDTLKRHFIGLEAGEVPAGALTALSRGLTRPLCPRIWMRADPVTIRQDGASFFLLSNAHLSLSPSELEFIQSPVATLVDHTPGMKFVGIDARAGLIQFDEMPDIITNPIYEALGKDIIDFLPSGPSQGSIHRLFTEIQMVLKGAISNEAMTSKNEVNAYWLWGLGVLPQALDISFDTVACQDSVIAGLCSLTSASLIKNVLNYAEWKNQLVDRPKDAKHLIVVTDFLDRDLTDLNYWQSKLCYYEKNWFSPLLSAFEEGEIEEISFEFSEGNAYVVQRNPKRLFWRSKSPIHKLINAEN